MQKNNYAPQRKSTYRVKHTTNVDRVGLYIRQNTSRSDRGPNLFNLEWGLDRTFNCLFNFIHFMIIHAV